MTSISIITPWSGSTADLLPDYYAAVQGAQVVTVDNACDHVTAGNLTAMHEQIGGEYIRNTTNRGFAAANNQGYARATGDIIVFLNSDIAADPRWLQSVAADVRDGALYGPALQHQLVYGMWLPYIEGWCIAATRGTWEKVTQALAPPPLAVIKPDVDEATFAQLRQEIRNLYGGGRSTAALPHHAAVEWTQIAEPGPWDAASYPGPYWEDNDLCLRALRADIQLIQTAWPLQHKGGRTAGPILRHGDSFERNRATFAGRVRGAWAHTMEMERW